MDRVDLYDEAEDCRRKAHCYLGQPEAPLLLRLADEFERLAAERRWRAERDPIKRFTE